MNLFNFLGRGAALAPSDTQRRQQAIDHAAEKARAQWLNALLVDQTRTWLSLGDQDPEILTGMAAMLTIAGFVHAHDVKDVEHPDMRVIRGAVSAARQCSAAGSVITVADAQAFSAGCERARVIIEAGSTAAIIYAAQAIRETVGLPS